MTCGCRRGFIFCSKRLAAQMASDLYTYDCEAASMQVSVKSFTKTAASSSHLILPYWVSAPVSALLWSPLDGCTVTILPPDWSVNRNVTGFMGRYWRSHFLGNLKNSLLQNWVQLSEITFQASIPIYLVWLIGMLCLPGCLLWRSLKSSPLVLDSYCQIENRSIPTLA